MCSPYDLGQLLQLSLPQIEAENEAGNASSQGEEAVFICDPLPLGQLPFITEGGERMSARTYYTLSGLRPKSMKYVNLESARKLTHEAMQAVNEKKARRFQDTFIKFRKDWLVKSSAVYLPYLDLGTHTRDFGTRCLGCKDELRARVDAAIEEWDWDLFQTQDTDPANKIYRKSEFVEHVKRCELAATLLRNEAYLEVLERLQRGRAIATQRIRSRARQEL